MATFIAFIPPNVFVIHKAAGLGYPAKILATPVYGVCAQNYVIGKYHSYIYMYNIIETM